MSERKRRGRAEWEDLLGRQKGAGWTDGQLSEQTGVSVQQIQRWKRIVGGRRVAALVEVPMTVRPSEREVRLRVGASMEFVLGAGWSVAEVAELVARLIDR